MWNFFFTILWWINSYIFEHIFETKILLQYKCLYCHFLSNQSINLWICEIYFHSSLKIKPYSSLTWLGFKGTHKLATWLAERDQVHWWLCGGGKQMGGVWGEAKLTGWAEYLWNFGYLKEGKQKKKQCQSTIFTGLLSEAIRFFKIQGQSMNFFIMLQSYVMCFHAVLWKSPIPLWCWHCYCRSVACRAVNCWLWSTQSILHRETRHCSGCDPLPADKHHSSINTFISAALRMSQISTYTA